MYIYTIKQHMTKTSLSVISDNCSNKLYIIIFIILRPRNMKQCV